MTPNARFKLSTEVALLKMDLVTIHKHINDHNTNELVWVEGCYRDGNTESVSITFCCAVALVSGFVEHQLSRYYDLLDLEYNNSIRKVLRERVDWFSHSPMTAQSVLSEELPDSALREYANILSLSVIMLDGKHFFFHRYDTGSSYIGHGVPQ